MSLRTRLAEHQDLLDRAELPTWARHGVPAFALVLGVVAIWDVNRAHLYETGQAPTVLATVLVALAVAPWVGLWFLISRPTDHCIPVDAAFSALVLVPLAALHVFGGRLGVGGLEAGGPQVSLMLLVLLVAKTASHAHLAVVAGTCLVSGAIVAGRAAQVTEHPEAFTTWFVALVAMAIGGLAIRSTFVALQRLTDAREELARKAVADERRRVASDIHDIVAHTLSVTMLYLTGARLAVEQDAETAITSLEEAERQGRKGMADVRRMVRLLRDPTDVGRPIPVDVSRMGPSTAPPPTGSGQRDGAPTLDPALPGLDDLPALIDSYREAGFHLETSISTSATAGPADMTRLARATAGDHDLDLSPLVELTIYRVIQESLANAARHGDGGAAVDLSVDAEHVAIRVRNACSPKTALDGDPATAGAGLVGMQERVAALGGTLRAEPSDPQAERGALSFWEVDAQLPLWADP